MKGLAFAAAIVFSFLLILPISAEGIELPEEYRDFSDAIPEDVASLLPDGFFSEDFTDLSDSVTEVSSPKYLFSLVWDLFSRGISGAFSLFAILVGLLALTALLNAFTEGLAAGNLKTALMYGTRLCSAAAVVGLQLPRIIAASEFFKRISILMNSLIPVMGVLYISGGNTMGAALTSSSLMLQINLIELGATALVIPSVCACMALTLADSLRTGESTLSGISASIKRTLSFVFGLCSTLLMASLSAQNILSAASDSAGARAVKFVAGNMIPVVGSTVGETLRTLASSVKLLRSTVGVAGIAAVALLLLPMLIELFLTRFALNSAAAIGELLGCKSAVKLYREIASLYGYVIASAAMASLLCIFSLTLFAVGSTAIGGLS